ncbi:Conserved hypothetical protein [Prochlorococcus marinus str. MIT 9303]|uniref:Uncharacterized protein n=1 Tax=Prochlorococcus marinus (strain MIT 9303) TaxID=59922 RepID=A2CBP5_PROM3|nr:Conserved hypothetical protein [Prochlorococcus marinus str. MIT 9303]
MNKRTAMDDQLLSLDHAQSTSSSRAAVFNPAGQLIANTCAHPPTAPAPLLDT